MKKVSCLYLTCCYVKKATEKGLHLSDTISTDTLFSKEKHKSGGKNRVSARVAFMREFPTLHTMTLNAANTYFLILLLL